MITRQIDSICLSEVIEDVGHASQISKILDDK